jgi:hypothetical protein
MVAESVCAGGVVEDEVVKGGRMKKTFAAVLAAACIGLTGCEDDGDTINEAPVIVVGSNSQAIVVSGNSGLVSVDQTTGEDNDDPSIYVTGNTGRVYVVSRPTPPEPKEP